MKKILNNPLLLVLSLFAVAVLFVGYKGEFPINDDWLFVRQIEAFFIQIIKINSAIDPSFIAQGWMGQIWGSLFGVSFESMRLLTLLVTLGLIVGTSKILSELKVQEFIHFIVLLLVAFNPLVFTSSFTFMTEAYFLLFYSLSIYFYLKNFRKNSIKAFLFGSVFAGLAFLVRQVGIVLFITYFIVLFWEKRFDLKKLVVILLPLVLSFYILSVVPRVREGEVYTQGGFTDLQEKLIEFDSLNERAFDMQLSLHYFIYFMLPLLFFKVKGKIPLYSIILFGGTFILLAEQLFLKDIFPVGSVFYIESLHSKSDFRLNLSIFDNVYFKYLLSLLISFGIFKFFTLFEKTKKLDSVSLFLLLTGLGSFGILLFGNDYYDRYLLPAFFSFILLFVYYFKDSLKYSKKTLILPLLLVIIPAVLLQQEYMAQTRLRWKQALAIQGATGYINSISVDGTYAKYSNAKKKRNYSGDVSGDPPGKFECYVQKYTINGDSKYFETILFFDTQIKRVFENPRAYESRKKISLPKIKKHLDEALYNEEYFSPIYNLVGKTAYVGSWCNSKEK